MRALLASATSLSISSVFFTRIFLSLASSRDSFQLARSVALTSLSTTTQPTNTMYHLPLDISGQRQRERERENSLSDYLLLLLDFLVRLQGGGRTGQHYSKHIYLVSYQYSLVLPRLSLAHPRLSRAHLHSHLPRYVSWQRTYVSVGGVNSSNTHAQKTRAELARISCHDDRDGCGAVVGCGLSPDRQRRLPRQRLGSHSTE